MKQYQYDIIHKQTARAQSVRCTAKSPEIARAQIVLMYGLSHNVLDLFSDINPPHKVLGEIDCSSFPDSDFAWLKSQADQIEAKQ